MKRPAIFLSAAIALSACGAMKKTQHMDKSDTQSKIDSSGAIVEASRITIDTTITLPSDTTTGSKPVQNVIAGEPLVIESGGQKVIVSYDNTTKNIQAQGIVKVRTVPVQAIKEETRVTTAEVKKEASQKIEREDYSKEREGSGFQLGVFSGVFLIALIVAIIIAMSIRRKFFRL